jgi:hypothetical protein
MSGKPLLFNRITWNEHSQILPEPTDKGFMLLYFDFELSMFMRSKTSMFYVVCNYYRMAAYFVSHSVWLLQVKCSGVDTDANLRFENDWFSRIKSPQGELSNVLIFSDC